ncbi:MAG: hypothetical protein PHE84_01825 [bacterium]|nr:hypothetical protein [bacterium]
MGLIEYEIEKHHVKRIRQALKRRGLIMDMEKGWEVHGPHPPHMNYQVYVGNAIQEADPKAKCICPNERYFNPDCKAHQLEFIVAIYPKAVFDITDGDSWRTQRPDSRLFCDE